ncbi:hypothetical protein SCLCIDRAFT_628271 [Scleroderma citrinum Foug A]|uniref:Uncharacterized protein n=1 Tax=Scleroderma citrinum Foug A TaxID=1036808 RepID=A0A0C3CSK4_9AGAM|nr:hypothetical protein SCLCIDRAFT_628271 [Scleroderma citrinum Foug A]
MPAWRALHHGRKLPQLAQDSVKSCEHVIAKDAHKVQGGHEYCSNTSTPYCRIRLSTRRNFTSPVGSEGAIHYLDEMNDATDLNGVE